MKKAILVNDYASVEALNKLLNEGYEVQSADDRGVYILKCDELKAEPIKRKAIDHDISTNITLDTTITQRSFDLLGEAVERMKRDNGIHGLGLKSLATPDMKQPHVRIEFDDIRDVPNVWVDGELMDDGANDKSLVSLKVDWNTDTATENHKGFDINYYDLTGERPMRRGFHEGSVM
ncbi:hypothetical protein PO181_02085 [Leuconostoc suionicum]|uniref:hypothetical protein n=1 Tax=Leuconostoc suionicum TaxID=1511761 RepID=UPI00233ECC8C|nr:hypothetical protein [Leuconostoc suionicum]MDC2815792.1 hypothetical protein [Leuconostoc suionicum]